MWDCIYLNLIQQTQFSDVHNIFHMCVNGLLLYCKNSIYYNINSNSFLQNNK